MGVEARGKMDNSQSEKGVTTPKGRRITAALEPRPGVQCRPQS